MLSSKGKHKLGKFGSKLSKNFEKFFSRVVTSSKKQTISEQCQRNASVIKSSTDRKTKIAKEEDGAMNIVKCYNNAIIFSDLEENWGETFNEISSSKVASKMIKMQGRIMK